MCIRIVLQYRCGHPSRYTTTRACNSSRCDGSVTQDETMSSVNLCEDCEGSAENRSSVHRSSASAGRSRRNATSRGLQIFEDEPIPRGSESRTSTSRRASNTDRCHRSRAPSPDENRHQSQTLPRDRPQLDERARRAVQSVLQEYGSQVDRERMRAWRNRTERGPKWMSQERQSRAGLALDSITKANLQSISVIDSLS